MLTWLQAVGRRTAECYARAFETVKPHFEWSRKFERSVRVSTADQDSAIEKSERHMADRSGVDGLLRIACHVHLGSSVISKGSDVIKGPISSLVHLTLSLNHPNAMPGFRKALQEVLADPETGVQVRIGVPPEHYAKQRNQILDLVFEGCAPHQRLRRAVVAALANGDWHSKVIEHWSPSPISRQTVLRKFVKSLCWAMASASPVVYPRHRWAGSEETMRWVLLLQSCHDLLGRAYRKWQKKVEVEQALTIDDGYHPDEADQGERHPAGAPADRGGAREPIAANLALALRDPSSEAAVADIVTARKRAATAWRASALAWLIQPASLPELLVFRRVHEGWRRLFSELLKISGTAWQRAQAWRELQSLASGQAGFSERDFRVTIASSGRHEWCEMVWAGDCKGCEGLGW